MRKIYTYKNLNPQQKRTGDCVVRAMAYFFGVDWRTAFYSLITYCADHAVVTFNYRSTYTAFLKEKGYRRMRAPEKGMTVGRFRDEYAEEGKMYLLQVPRHLTIIDDRVLIDTWDCSDRKLEGYWMK